MRCLAPQFWLVFWVREDQGRVQPRFLLLSNSPQERCDNQDFTQDSLLLPLPYKQQAERISTVLTRMVMQKAGRNSPENRLQTAQNNSELLIYLAFKISISL